MVINYGMKSQMSIERRVSAALAEGKGALKNPKLHVGHQFHCGAWPGDNAKTKKPLFFLLRFKVR